MTPPPSGLANASGSLRQEMAAASTIPMASPTRCQARTRLYRDGRLELEGFPVADISEHLTDESVTIWLDLLGPDHDDLAVLSEEFGLHPLAVEGCDHRHPYAHHRLLRDERALPRLRRESRPRRFHRHHRPGRAVALPHFQAQGLAVRPKSHEVLRVASVADQQNRS